MDVYALANCAIQQINPDLIGEWRQSTGYTTDDAGSRTPTYSSQFIAMQIQAASAKELTAIDGMGLQGIFRKVFILGDLLGVIRADQKGGDVILFPDITGGPTRTWKVMQVVESWNGWTSAIIWMQA